MKGGKMSKKLNKIMTITMAFLLLNSSVFVYSQYQINFQGRGNLQVAQAKIRLISNSTYLEVLDKNTYFEEFRVVNYDENEQVTSVPIAYKIIVKTNDSDAPLNFELCQLQADGTKIKTDLANEFVLQAGQKQENLYQLAISYDFSDKPLNDDTEVFVELEAWQI